MRFMIFLSNLSEIVFCVLSILFIYIFLLIKAFQIFLIIQNFLICFFKLRCRSRIRCQYFQWKDTLEIMIFYCKHFQWKIHILTILADNYFLFISFLQMVYCCNIGSKYDQFVQSWFFTKAITKNNMTKS